MKRTNADVSFPRFLTISDVEYGTDGFRAPDSDSELIRWSDVDQVALLYEIHPIAIEDWNCVAFRLRGEQLSVWVALEKNELFIAEVERRFAPLVAPAMKDWMDEPRCIRTYSVWPMNRLGEPLYVSRRIHWWSWEKSLAFKKRANQPPQTTTGSSAPSRV